MKYAFFQGCNIPIRIKQYAESTKRVLQKLGVELEIVDQFNCCGYPARNVDETAYILPSVRNLAIAQQRGLDIMVVCNCCFASLQKAKNVMESDTGLAEKLTSFLSKEGLSYSGKTQVKHFLTVLHQDVGVDTIKKNLVKQFTDLKISLIHGCHILRPREITRFDDSFVPGISEDLLALTGATSLDWPGRMECCGAALAGINDELSQKLLCEKITGAQLAGAEYITPVCAYCHLQFDTAQQRLLADAKIKKQLPVLLYPQLLGLCMGLDQSSLGIRENSTIDFSDITKLQALLGPVEEKKKKKSKKKTPVSA
ncbi:CoB--CoM heterodisulfide reductase iron-sulfur subunit B family protein [Desulforhopalus singaporensis]|uniref:Heterodisulfide reductase subunit B n=1 Tax=Desulforhopalus singaporensis TaxID=91360 RepID=A0A1H0MTT0_9BACT|nr:CoB--CoM heterodisulfide reductase iron-sulfur subunit B family protein [Desulforhopalus singaporensis]SDO83859.1 heterodisulfide reductase subunit B [Desulforhopalus singaporensis]